MSQGKADKVLVVDDSGTARMIIIQCMQIAGLRESQFFEAKNGMEALKIVAKENPDLIVTDINMPVMDGRQFLGALQHDGVSLVPTIVISSLHNDIVVAELKSLGAAHVLRKPVNPASILEALTAIQVV